MAGVLPIALLLLAGCNRTRSVDVVATVNGHAIMRPDMDRMVRQQLAQAQGQQQQTPESEDQLRLSVIKSLIDEEIVAQRAAKMNLTATPAEVDAKVAEMKAPYSEDQFAANVTRAYGTLDNLRHDIRQSLTINKLLNEEINSKVTITDADVTSYFNAHKAEFNLVEPAFHVAVIRVTSIPSPQPGNLQGSKATTDAEAKKKIQALKVRLDSGEDFGAVAANFSEDPSTAPSGGDMGFVPETQLRADPTIGAALLKLAPGHVTDIFPIVDPQTKKQVGYSIFKLIEREPAGQREISDPVVLQHIRQLLRDGRSQLLKDAYFEMLRDQAKVENFYAEEIFKSQAK